MEAALIEPTVSRECDAALRRLLEHGIPAAEVVKVLPPYDVGDPAEVLYLSMDLKPMRALCHDLVLDRPGVKPVVKPGW